MIGALGRRVLGFLVEPEPPAPAPPAPLAVGVVGLSEACGVSTVARGLTIELPQASVADGAWPDRCGVIVAVADGGGVPVLAGLVAERLAERRRHVVLVANRPADPAEWGRAGALCVPASRLGVVMLERGLRPRGGMGSALRELARAVRDAPP